MESEKWIIKLKVNIMANGRMEKEMEKDYLHMETKMYIQANGLMGKSMVKEHMYSMILLWE